LNIIRHQISKNGLDPFLQSSLLLDAPELLQEITEPTGRTEGVHSDVPTTTVGQQVPDDEYSCVANGAQDATSNATAKEDTPRTDTVPALSPSEWAPFMEEFSNEQFDEIFSSAMADGIYPLSPSDAFLGASSDS